MPGPSIAVMSLFSTVHYNATVLLNTQRPSALQGQRAINSKDSACFWWTLYVVVSPA